jgi:biopolymer transport protein ExbD
MSGSMPVDEEESETDKINVVPLADLSLVLLIILMVLSPMVMSSMIRVQTPRLDKVKAAQAKKDPNKIPDPLLIKITAEGIFMNGTKYDDEKFLAEQINIKLNEDAERPVIVSADDAIQVGDVVHMLDLAKQSGAMKVSLLKGGPAA